MKYRKKPVIIEAVQWDGTFLGTCLIEGEFPDMRTMSKDYNVERNECYFWRIETLEGTVSVSPQDYIIKGIKGEFYPCKPDIFEKSYERVE